FAGWRGACSGKSVICTVRVGRAKLVALFRRVYRLTWTVVGNGEVSASHAGTPGGARVLQGTNTSTLSSADSLTLTASAPSGTRFEGFSGSCTGRAHSCTLAADAPKSVTATFSPGSDGTITYGINVTRSAAGLVTSDPAGIDCGPNTRCSSAWPANQRVTLHAHAGPKTKFTGWGGPCSGTTTCTVTVPAAEGVTATFKGATSSCLRPGALAIDVKASAKPRRIDTVWLRVPRV